MKVKRAIRSGIISLFILTVVCICAVIADSWRPAAWIWAIIVAVSISNLGFTLDSKLKY